MKTASNGRTIDASWRIKSLKPLLLMLVPIFFFFVFFVMAKKSKQDGYKKLGLFFGALSIVSFVLVLAGTWYQPLVYCVTLHLGAWALCLYRAIKVCKRYQQYLEWAQEDEEKERDARVQDSKWRFFSSLWLIWSCIPLLGGLGTYFVGHRIGNRALKIYSVCAIVFSLVLFVTASLLFATAMKIETFAMAIGAVLIYANICIPILLAGIYRQEYLDAFAKMQTQDCSQYPVMNSLVWRCKNSLWQLLTFVPYIGTMGLFIVGVHRSNLKVLLWACVLCLSELACVAGPSLLLSFQPLQGFALLQTVAGILSFLWFFVYIMVIYYGALIRYDMLWERAYDLENN